MKEKLKGIPFDKIKYIVIILALLMAFAIIGKKNAPDILYRSEAFEKRLADLPIVQTNDYEVKGNQYHTTGVDPWFMLECGTARIHSVELVFAEPLKESAYLQLYFYKNGLGFDQSNVDGGYINEGQYSYELTFKRMTDNFLRVDLDGDFELKDVIVKGEVFTFSRMKAALYLLFSLIMTAILFLIIKNIRKIIRFIDEKTIIGWILDRREKVSVYKVYVILAVFLGVAYSVLIPMNRIPDEHAHIRYIEQYTGMEGFLTQYYEVVRECKGLARGKQNTEKIDLEAYKELYHKPLDKEQIVFKGKVSWKIVQYLPSAPGLFLGILLNLPVIWCLQLGEWTALIFMILTGLLALKLMPVKKELLCALLLMPINVQQCASFNYDASMLPACYLIIVYFIHLKYEKYKITWKSLLYFLIMLIPVMLVKPVHVVLLMICLTLAYSQIDLRIGKINLADLCKKHFIIAGILFMVAFVGGLYVIRNNIYVLILRSCLYEFHQGWSIIRDTLKLLWRFYLDSMVGQFGLMETDIPGWYLWFTFLTIFVLGQVASEKLKLRVWDRFVFIATAIGSVLFILIAMILCSFVEIDLYPVTLAQCREFLYKVGLSLGVQGRYFFPAFMCLSIGCTDLIKVKKRFAILWQDIYYVLLIVVTISIILKRFWLA